MSKQAIAEQTAPVVLTGAQAVAEKVATVTKENAPSVLLDIVRLDSDVTEGVARAIVPLYTSWIVGVFKLSGKDISKATRGDMRAVIDSAEEAQKAIAEAAGIAFVGMPAYRFNRMANNILDMQEQTHALAAAVAALPEKFKAEGEAVAKVAGMTAQKLVDLVAAKDGGMVAAVAAKDAAAAVVRKELPAAPSKVGRKPKLPAAGPAAGPAAPAALPALESAWRVMEADEGGTLAEAAARDLLAMVRAVGNDAGRVVAALAYLSEGGTVSVNRETVTTAAAAAARVLPAGNARKSK